MILVDESQSWIQGPWVRVMWFLFACWYKMFVSHCCLWVKEYRQGNDCRRHSTSCCCWRRLHFATITTDQKNKSGFYDDEVFFLFPLGLQWPLRVYCYHHFKMQSEIFSPSCTSSDVHHVTQRERRHHPIRIGIKTLILWPPSLFGGCMLSTTEEILGTTTWHDSSSGRGLVINNRSWNNNNMTLLSHSWLHIKDPLLQIPQ